jgi:3-oxoacyl-[acyl-carrier protein] reductase
VDLGLEGRVALVTGASKGLGRGIAAALAAEGARVAMASRSRERIEAAAAEVDGDTHGFVHDTADAEGAERLVAEVTERLGGLDVLVVNTGGPPANADALAFGPEEWDQAYRALVRGPMALVTAALPGMRERGWGRVLAVSSSAVREPIAPLMLSNTHRSALLAAFKTVARQVAGDGVTLNSLLPGRIATDRLIGLAGGSREAAEESARHDVPAGRLGRVEEFAAAAAFLCSDPASYITGTALLVDGGLTHSV